MTEENKKEVKTEEINKEKEVNKEQLKENLKTEENKQIKENKVEIKAEEAKQAEAKEEPSKENIHTKEENKQTEEEKQTKENNDKIKKAIEEARDNQDNLNTYIGKAKETREDVQKITKDATNFNEEKIKNIEESSKEERDTNEDLFVTEKDTFDIEIKWYKDGKKLYIKDSEDNETFNNDYENINTLIVTFKYPSQGDYEIISGTRSFKSIDQMGISEWVQFEITRMVTLVRKWNLKQDLSRMIDLDPSIVKVMLDKVREELGMKGII